MGFDISLEIRPQQGEVLDFEVEGLDDEDYDSDKMQVTVTSGDHLFDENKNPVGKTIHERVEEAILNKSPSTYVEDIDNRLLHLDGHFYRLKK